MHQREPVNFSRYCYSDFHRFPCAHDGDIMENPCYSGGCLCGHIRFQAHGLPCNPHSCSCDFCRRHSGAPTLCWVEFPRQAVEWNGPGGMPALYRSSPYSSRAFARAAAARWGRSTTSRRWRWPPAASIGPICRSCARPHMRSPMFAPNGGVQTACADRLTVPAEIN